MSTSINSLLRVLVIVILPLFSLADAGAVTAGGGGDRGGRREFQFEYKATVKDIPAGTKKFSLWMPIPHDNPFQKVRNLEVESPYKFQIRSARHGNKMLYIGIDEPQRQGFTVSVRFDVVRKEHRQGRLQNVAYSGAEKELEGEIGDSDMQRWLQPDRLVPIDGQIRQWAHEVVDAAGAKTDLEKARAIYNHVIATVKYDKTGQGWGRGDIYYACDARRGNCTDFHAIFIGYTRAVGVPARFAIGFPLPADRGAGEVSGYHCWAEFYVKGIGWVPVDASEAAKDPARREYFFGAHDENRIEFSVGRDLTLNPTQANEPLNYFIYPYAEADGRTFSSIERSFTYRDAAAAGDE